MSKRTLLALTVLTALSTPNVGCRVKTITHPDNPLINRDPITFYALTEQPPGSGKFVELGKITIPPGMTIWKYDWSPVP